MNCPSCSPQLPLPPPSNVPPLLCPPPPPLSSTPPPPPLFSTPPPPLSRTPPTPRRRTRRSSKGRWFKSDVATGSAVSLSSFTFVGFVFVIIRRYFKQGGDKPSNNSGTNKSGNIKVPLVLSIEITVPDQTVKRQSQTRQDKKTPPDTPTSPDTPCCDSCASDWTPSRRTCYDSYVQGSCTQAYPVEWSTHQAAMGVTEPVNEEYYIEPAEYIWSKLCD